MDASKFWKGAQKHFSYKTYAYSFSIYFHTVFKMQADLT